MKKTEWYSLKKGDKILSKKDKERTVIATRITRGNSYCIELESGAVYCTGDRHLFKNKINKKYIMKIGKKIKMKCVHCGVVMEVTPVYEKNSKYPWYKGGHFCPKLKEVSKMNLVLNNHYNK